MVTKLRVVTINGKALPEPPIAPLPRSIATAMRPPAAAPEDIPVMVKETLAMLMAASVALEVLAGHGIVRSTTYEMTVDLVAEALKRVQRLDAVCSSMPPTWPGA